MNQTEKWPQINSVTRRGFCGLLVVASFVGCRTDDTAQSAARCFGLVADIQYADQPDAGGRHYRAALSRQARSVAAFNERQPAFVVQLGDLINGYPKDPARSARELDAVLAGFAPLRPPLHHVVGNHCLTVGRDALCAKLGLEMFYGTFADGAFPGWRFIVLDGNDDGYGVIGEVQLIWFREVLRQAEADGERVICFCHFPVSDGAARHHLTDPAPVLRILDESRCVVAWFAGHDHAGGYTVRNGVHHVTLRGQVESKDVDPTQTFVEIHDRCLILSGTGAADGRRLFPDGRNGTK